MQERESVGALVSVPECPSGLLQRFRRIHAVMGRGMDPRLIGGFTPGSPSGVVLQGPSAARPPVIGAVMKRPGFPGYTLIEVLVAISLIGFLLALFLPAVQSARESARRMQCLNHLKQIGIGLHSYASSTGVFPPVNPITKRFANGDFYSVHCHSPLVRMLPELEQRPLFDTINFDGSPISSPMLWANSTAMMTRLNLFMCESDRGVSVPGYGRVNYRFDLGPSFAVAAGDIFPLSWSGPFTVHRVYHAADYPDGLSNTAAVSERLQGGWQDGVFKTHGDYYLTNINIMSLRRSDQAIAACMAARNPASVETRGGESWFLSGLHFTCYNHCAPPNPTVFECVFDDMREGIPRRALHDGVISATSCHPGGVNVACMDGSVKFVRETIDLTVWRAFSTRNGGEVLTDGY